MNFSEPRLKHARQYRPLFRGSDHLYTQNRLKKRRRYRSTRDGRQVDLRNQEPSVDAGAPAPKACAYRALFARCETVRFQRSCFAGDACSACPNADTQVRNPAN